LTITVNRLAGANAVLSGIFLGDAGNPPLDFSTAPQGGWVGTYGVGGYDLAGFSGGSDVSSLPSSAISLAQGQRGAWVSGTSDARALQSVDKSTRTAGVYYDGSQVRVVLTLANGFVGNLHLYAVDWDSTSRRETIAVNGAQVANLGTDFSQGAWVNTPVNIGAGGTLTITVNRLAGANAVLSGIFLGDAGNPPPAVP
jgi:hypothetical protein